MKIDSKDPKGNLSKIALDALRNIFQLCLQHRADPIPEVIIRNFEAFGGLDSLEALQYHPVYSIYTTAQSILLQFFE